MTVRRSVLPLLGVLMLVLGAVGSVTAQEAVTPPPGVAGSNPCLDTTLQLRCPDRSA